jgi:cell wall assembly regulator SMI1
MDESTNDSFAEIEGWLGTNAPPLVKLLNPPVDEAAITAFETQRKLRMPPEVKRLYLIHNGESKKSDGIFGCWKMLPLAEIEKEIELTGETGIIPLFRSGGGDLYYVKRYDSLKPDHRLFEWWHENPADAEVIAESVERFLFDSNQKLKRGQYVYRPEELAALIDRDEL